MIVKNSRQIELRYQQIFMYLQYAIPYYAFYLFRVPESILDYFNTIIGDSISEVQYL
jgi:hypothetical protein